MKRIVILGSTGSIGRSTLEIVERSGADFEVVGLAAGGLSPELKEQLARFPGARFALGRGGGSEAALRSGGAATRARFAGNGSSGMADLVRETAPDLVVNALAGIAGLVPTVASLEAGIPVALANKETLVAAGELVAPLAAARGARIIPIDSEHFSIARCLGSRKADATEIILTASGGPFHSRLGIDLDSVASEEVLAHPTWDMGPKVTVDSALLLNKGLEVIEAHWLFGFPYERIGVVVHPQSIVHALVRLRDGSLVALLAPADMRLPIMNALHDPAIPAFPWESLRVEDLGRLEFVPLDEARFPAFRLSLAAAAAGGTAPAVLNAADEVAVAAFLDRRIRFMEIVRWIEEALGAHRARPLERVGDVLEADRWTREFLAGRYREAVPRE